MVDSCSSEGAFTYRLLSIIQIAALLGAAALVPGAIAEPPARNGGYAAAAACSSCHAEIARKYAQTAMGRSFSRPGPQNTIEDYSSANTFAHTPSARYYTMRRGGGEYFERRHQTGFDGRESNVLEERIDFIIGSGDHARTYLHRAPDGGLIELPVSWYAENGGRWGMSPGYDRPAHDDFRRSIGWDCMFCHNAYPADLRYAPGAGEARFPAELPQGIDCQRCHGPGGAHVEAASAGRPSEAIRNAIVNPARLPRERQFEVCMQCHLETTSRKLPNSIRRFDRAPFSYRPGQPLAEYAIYFDRAPGSGHDDDFEVAHQAYRLRKSACFQKSAMTCTTCHDPHEQIRGKDAIAHYIAACKSCHGSAHSRDAIASNANGATCLDCHMPKRRAEDAIRVVLTDHFIQRFKPDRDLTAAIPETEDKPWRGEVIPYYPVTLPRTPENELYLAAAQVRDGANLEAGIHQLSAAIERYKPAPVEFDYQLGIAYADAGNNHKAAAAYRAALRKRTGYRDALVQLTAALVSSGDLTQAAEAASGAIAAHPDDASSLVNLGNIDLREGKAAAAINAFERALKLEPGEPAALNLLGLAELKQGNTKAAETAFREAIRYQPDLTEAHNNLGNLLAAARKYPEAGFHFEKAIESDPRSIEAYRSYSLILGIDRDFDRAIAVLQQGLAAVPDSVEAHVDLADLLAAAGRADLAEAEYRSVVEKKPSLAEAQLQLGLLLIRSGRAAEAREHLQAAAQSADPEIRGAALRALQ